LAAEIDVEVGASAAVVVVALEEAVGGAVVGVDVGAVDLKPQLARGGPDQGAHAAVADGHARFAALDGLVVDEVGAGDQVAEVDVQQGIGLRSRLRQRAGNRRKNKGTSSHRASVRTSPLPYGRGSVSGVKS